MSIGEAEIFVTCSFEHGDWNGDEIKSLYVADPLLRSWWWLNYSNPPPFIQPIFCLSISYLKT